VVAQCLQGRGEGRRPAAVVHDVRTLAPREVSHRVLEAAAAGHQHVIGAGVFRHGDFSGRETRPITLPPLALISWVSISPTPPAAACTTAVSPGLMA